MDSEPEGFNGTGVTLRMLIKFAYGVEDKEISGLPNGLGSDRYDIHAKSEDSVIAALQKLSRDQQRLESRRMLQTLLSDRFSLAVHRETQTGAVYALVVATNGPRVRRSHPADNYPNGYRRPDGLGGGGLMMMDGKGGTLTCQAISIRSLAATLASQLGRTVIDKTGLEGDYDFTLQWTPDDRLPPPAQDSAQLGTPQSSETASNRPGLFTAIQEQLGLKLQSTKGPVEIIVVDHVERASQN